MTRFLLQQSNVFIAIALMVILLSSLLTNLNTAISMLSLVLIIAFFGVPHGALDMLFAQKAFTLTNLKAWIQFISTYLLISMLVVGLWLLLPTVFFLVFLGFSAAHFADDLGNSTPKLLRYLYGVSIITLPSIFHTDTLVMLYGYMIEATIAPQIVYVMKLLAMAAMVLMLYAAFIFRHMVSRRLRVEILMVCALMLLVTPLLAFTIYFCFMHSARHIIKARYYFDDVSNKAIMLTLVLPTLAVVLFCAVIFILLPVGQIDENLIKVTFVALAALTFPHAFLLNKIDFLNAFK